MMPPNPGCPPKPISMALWANYGSTLLMLDRQDQELFHKFRYRTIYALGGDGMVSIWENNLVALTLSVSLKPLEGDHSLAALSITQTVLKVSDQCPFLLHGTLAVAAVHDRYLGVTPLHRRTLRESYHWSQCTILFNKWLRQPIKEEHKDPLWATAGSLGILTFSSVNVSTKEEVWPLGAPDASDLEWLRLGTGKMALWKLVDPMRPTSAYRGMHETFRAMHQPLPDKGIDGIPIELVRACGLDESSTRENNPYFVIAHGLRILLQEPIGKASMGKCMTVTSHMHNGFDRLLERKDPVALMLLLLWYMRAGKSVWWIDLRARYEIPAIRTYLQRYHGDNTAIQALLSQESAAQSLLCT